MGVPPFLTRSRVPRHPPLTCRDAIAAALLSVDDDSQPSPRDGGTTKPAGRTAATATADSAPAINESRVPVMNESAIESTRTRAADAPAASPPAQHEDGAISAPKTHGAAALLRPLAAPTQAFQAAQAQARQAHAAAAAALASSRAPTVAQVFSRYMTATDGYITLI